jgi:hypothetical protein
VIHRTRALPHPQDVTGLPCAPVARTLADAVADLADTETVRRLLTEAVRGGHCDASAVLRELADAELLERPQVAASVGALRGADRAMAEERLYAMVRGHHLPDPVWNVDLRLPGGPPLGAVDAYWPEHAVALAIGPPAGRLLAGQDAYEAQGDGGPAAGDVHADPFGDALDAADGGETRTMAAAFGEDEGWSRFARQREHLEALGITIVHVTPAKLRDAAEQQAAVVRTALTAAPDHLPAAYVVVTPR